MSIVRLIIEMLQLFNVEVDENSILRIKDNDFSYIYDKNGNEIGKIVRKKDDFKVEILNKDYHLNLYSYKNEVSYIKYKLYFMNEDKMLIGNTRVCFEKRYNDFIRKASISIYENGENTNSYYFNSLENNFNLFDIKTGEKVFYRNNSIYHEDDKKSVLINCNRLNANYEINEKHSNRLFTGNLPIYGPYVSSDYSIIDGGINHLLNEFDTEYFDFLRSSKESLNYFSDNLFENFSGYTLKGFNEKQLYLILGIESENKGNKLVKKTI